MKASVNLLLSLIFMAVVTSCTGCHRRIGEPDNQEELMRPENVVSFDRLYRQNCSACHGENGSGGPAMDLSNSTYQALVDDTSLRRWITSGMPGTEMPAFGESAGGFLTSQQIDILVTGMRMRWAPKNSQQTHMPSYLDTAEGDPNHGGEIFRGNCISCHEHGKQKITDLSYLALVSDQSLRTIVIAGRPDIGQPDWRRVRTSEPLTDQDANDVVAYLHSLRIETPGQPYPDPSAKR
jgi:mono/diheme cytochrome c family protein